MNQETSIEALCKTEDVRQKPFDMPNEPQGAPGMMDEKAEPIFIITEEDVQITAKDILDRELTPEEMHVVKKGIESGLDDWSMVVSIAVRYAAGQG